MKKVDNQTELEQEIVEIEKQLKELRWQLFWSWFRLFSFASLFLWFAVISINAYFYGKQPSNFDVLLFLTLLMNINSKD